MLPFFNLFNSITVYSYPLMMGIAWAVGFIVLDSYNNIFSKPIKDLKIFFLSLFISSWFGAKFFFILTIKNNAAVSSHLNFWLGGGLVFYGGLVFGLCMAFLFFKFKKIPFFYLNILIPSLAIGHGIGRIGCFLAGCCYGKTSDFFWSVFMHSNWRHPVQIYEAIFQISIGILIGRYLSKQVEKNKSLNSLWINYLITYSIFRFFIEYLRDDTIRGIWSFGLSTSQIVSLIIFVISLLIGLNRISQMMTNHS